MTWMKFHKKSLRNLNLRKTMAMRYEDVRTWEDFKEYAKSTSPAMKAEMEKLDKLVDAIVFFMDGFEELEALPVAELKSLETKLEMRFEDVNTWDDYELYMREKSPEAKAEMEKLDKLVESIVYAIDGLKEIEMGIELYNLEEEEEESEVI